MFKKITLWFLEFSLITDFSSNNLLTRTSTSKATMTIRRRDCTLQTGSTEPVSRPRSLSAPIAATAVGYGVLLLAYHVKADAEYLESSEEAPFLQRVQKGPFGFSNLDLLLFGAFVLMAFELLQFAAL